MMVNRRSFAALVLGLPSLAAWAAEDVETAVRFEGLRFERRIMLAGAPLLLNGTGLRAVAWFKGFAAALYLVERSATAPQVLSMAGPKRLQLRMLHEVPADEFAKAFHKGVSRNAAAEEMPRLAARMAAFEALVRSLGTVRKGDTVDLDLDPARGLLFTLNGTLRGEPLPGEDFYAALLRSFIGDRPYDQRLKSGLLGRPA
ncbi:MAG: chalcone isomerase family protein [Rubrivivax sp.]|nr:chalcone isomerase family protein [Rubrivivax sp.]